MFYATNKTKTAVWKPSFEFLNTGTMFTITWYTVEVINLTKYYE